MIIVEERFRELFDTIPDLVVGGGSYKPTYSFGSHKDLLRWMNSKRKTGGVNYPLIWLETPVERTIVRNGNINLSGLTLILATLSNSQQSNTERLETTFKPTLNPLYDYVIKAMKHGGFISVVSGVEIQQTNFYNYGVDEDEHQSTDIWDAIKIDLDLIMTDECLREINY